MISEGSTLPYQSRDAGATEPGEVVLWESSATPLTRKLTLTYLLGLVVCACVVVAAWYYEEVVPLWVAAVGTLAFAVAALVGLNRWFRRNEPVPVTATHRITDRRIIRTQERGAPSIEQLPLEDLVQVTVLRDRKGRTSVRFNG